MINSRLPQMQIKPLSLSVNLFWVHIWTQVSLEYDNKSMKDKPYKAVKKMYQKIIKYFPELLVVG